MTSVIVNEKEYSDDGSSARDMRGGGHRTYLLPMIADTMVEVGRAVSAGAQAVGARDQALVAQAAAAGSAEAAAADRVAVAADKASTQTALATAQALVGSAGTGTATGLVYAALTKWLVSAADIVAVYIYDTRLDSDGGAWAARPFGSWYWEALGTATRGATRRFPAVALIVARGASLTIYDAHDLDSSGAPRMWMVFNRTFGGTVSLTQPISSVFACNGRIFLTQGDGTDGNLVTINFPGDTWARRWDAAGGHAGYSLARRNINSFSPVSGAPLVSYRCYHVHARPLPGAPLDGAGLPIPTVAVATAAGTSIIHPWGRICSITNAYPHVTVEIGADGFVYGNGAFDSIIRKYPLPYADIASSASGVVLYSYAAWGAGLIYGAAAWTQLWRAWAGGFAARNSSGLGLVVEDAGNPAAGMQASVGIGHNSGWLPGDIRGAWLCDTVTGAITGPGEMVVNGDFAGGTTGWLPGTDATQAVAGGEMEVTGAGAYNYTQQAVATVAGQTYTIVALARKGTSNAARLAIYSGADLGDRIVTAGTATQVHMTFVAGASVTYVSLTTGASAGTAYFSGVSMRLALPDRSVKGRGIGVHGTLSRTALSCGIAAVSGWGAAHYLEQPYSPELDFGTGDFCVVAWISAEAADAIRIERAYYTGGAYSGARWSIYSAGAGQIAFRVHDGTAQATVTSTSAPQTGSIRHLAAVKRGTAIELWIDGVREATVSAATVGSLTNASAILRVGTMQDGQLSSAAARLAVMRSAAYAPTPAQIRRMWEDERALIVGGMAATLGGTASFVQTLAANDAAGTLAVGTNDGVSIFAGLGRVQYLDGASGGAAIGSDTIVSVSASGPHLLIGTAAGAGVIGDGVIARDRLVPAGRPRASPADGPGVVTMRGVTADATPTDLTPRVIIGEREAVTLDVTVQARTYGAASTQGGTYRRLARYIRDAGGNVTLSGSVQTIGTDQETSAGMDAALSVDTAAQTVAVRVTGVAATRMVWTARVVVTRISEDLTYAQ